MAEEIKDEVKAQPAAAAKDAAKPTAKAATKSAAKPAAKDAVKPAAKDAAKPAVKDAAKPAVKDAAKPAVKDAAKPVATDDSKPAAKDAAKPVATDDSKPAAPDAAKPAVADAAKPAPDGAAEGDAKVVRRRIKGSKNIPVGVVHILASFNNTTVSVSDPRGNVISWSSGGRCGFKGSRKSTAYAGTIVAQEACKVALGHGLNEVEIRVQGPGSGRESAIRAVQAAGLAITGITDITPIAHNGCRARKRRRV